MIRTEFNKNPTCEWVSTDQIEIDDLLTVLKFFFVNGGWLISGNFTTRLFRTFDWWSCICTFLLSFCWFILIYFGTTFMNFSSSSGLALILINTFVCSVNISHIACPDFITFRCIGGLILWHWFVWTCIIRISAFGLVVGAHRFGWNGYNRRIDGRLCRINIFPSIWIVFIV